MESEAHSLTPFMSPWTERLFVALGSVEHSILLVSPYIKDNALAAVERELAQLANVRHITVRVLARVRCDDLLAGSSDIGALERIVGWVDLWPQWTVELRAQNNLHAKVWVLDEQVAFVGSGNLSPSGLEGNVEYGVELRDHSIVTRILADWRTPWGRATPITREALAPYRRAYERVMSDAKLREAREEFARRQAEALNGLDVPPHVGAAFPIPRSGRLAPTIGSPGQRGLTLEARLDHLLEALRWVIPREVDEADEADEATPRLSLFSALKITCERVDLDPQTKFGRATIRSQIRLTWADNTREMEASLLASVIDDPALDTPVPSPWAVTLGAEAIQQVARMLFSYRDQMPPAPNAMLALRLAIEPSHTRLSLEVWRVMLAGERLEDVAEETHLGQPLTVDVAPAPWDAGFQEVTSPAITAQMDAQALDHALRLLTVEMGSRDARRTNQPGAQPQVVELRLDTFLTTILLKRAGSRGNPEQVVPLKELKGGSVPAFRVDQQALLQMAHFHRVAGVGQTYTIRIPQHAEFIEFEPNRPLNSVGFINLTGWRCRLRSIE